MSRKFIALLLAVIMGLSLIGCGEKKEEQKTDEEAAAPYTEVLEEVDMSPPDFAGYSWEGDYLDATGGQAMLHIEPAARRTQGYDILIYIPGGEASFSTWSATAIYDESVGGLTYKDCVRSNVDTGENGAMEVAYRNGTGAIIPNTEGSDTLLWIDNQDRRGVDLRFERIQEGG